MDVGINLNDNTFPSMQRLRTIDNTNKVVFDGRLKSLHETRDLGLLRHIKMGQNFDEACEIRVSRTSLNESVEFVFGGLDQAWIREFLLELVNES